jgi:hypothetical protein
MRANFIHIQDLAIQALQRSSGDFVEIGVWWGTTFVPLAELCRQAGRTIHAVDSFLGMAAPTENDGPKMFRKGALSTGGSDHFRMLTDSFSNVVVHEGWVPDIFAEMKTLSFAFAHIDLDQYQPMLRAMNFVWSRLNAGGIMVCHDWLPDREILAAKAIRDWSESTGVAIAGENGETEHAWFVKELVE